MEFVLTATPMALVYWAITLLWIGEFLVFPSRRYGDAEASTRSFWALVLGITLLLVLDAVLHQLRVGNVPGVAGDVIRWSGLALYGAGVLLRYRAGRALGPWFSRHVRTSPDQELVSSGPYRRLRHPLYIGLLLIASGMGLLFANLPGAVATLLGSARLVGHRMAAEERRLEEALGERYLRWKAERRRLLPRAFCPDAGGAPGPPG